MRRVRGARASTACTRRSDRVRATRRRAPHVAAFALRLLVVFALGPTLVAAQEDAGARGPETVTVQSGKLTLHALLWLPGGNGPFPAVLFNHGSGFTAEPEKPAALGPLFAARGYAFLFLYRRGSGLSADAGTSADELMKAELTARGEEARDRLQLRLLDEHLDDAFAGLAFLRARADVDPKRVAVVGHSFGGMLALLMAERDSSIAAVVDFAGGAKSWAASDELRARLMAAVDKTTVPVFFIHANNDYSIAPGEALANEMLSLDKTRRLEIYPGVGQTAEDGHNLVYLGVAFWQSDVFTFLDEHTRK